MSGGYDRALTVFSPDGHLLQVEYAAEAVSKGCCVVGIVADTGVVIGVERRATAKLQDPKTAKKIAKLDDTVVLAFSGLQADARVVIDMARVECQRYRLNMEVEPSVDYIGRYIARMKQKYTIRGGRRPFGISTLIGGLTTEKTPRLLQTEPHGIITSWKAQAIGRNASLAQDFLNKKLVSTPTLDEAFKLTLSTLFEIVETSQDSVNIEIVQVTSDGILTVPEERISEALAELEIAKQEAAKKSSGAVEDQ